MNSNITLNKRKTLLATFVAMFAAGATTQGAMAQTESATEQWLLEEIIVTATRREQNIQEVPVSVSAISGNDITNLGAQRFQDIALPNVIFDSAFSAVQPQISIRGMFQAVDRAGIDQGVGVYVDGVYVGSPQMVMNMDVGDIERLELLRGPQGTLFGKNTVQGALNVITKAPGNELGGHVEVQSGNYDLRRLRGSIDVPIIKEVLAARLSLHEFERDGYVKHVSSNSGDASDGGAIDSSSGRLQLLYTPGTNFTARLAFDYLNDDLIRYTPESLLDDPSGLDGDTTPYTTHGDEGFESIENSGVSLVMDYEFESGYTFTSVTGLRNDETFSDYDLDYVPADLIRAQINSNQEQWSQEFRISSPADSWYDFVAGIYWFEQINEQNFSFSNIFSFDMSTDTQIDVSNWAAFGNFNLNLNDKITIFLGGRFTDETKEIDYLTTGTAVIPFTLLPEFKEKENWDDFSWSAGVRYQITDSVMAYGSISTGFKSGGFNNSVVREDNKDFLVLDPENVTNYELGMKSEWFDSRLRLNMAAFFIEYENLQAQAQFISPITGFPVSAYRNAAKTESKGGELELSALITEELSLNFGVGYVRSVYDDFPGAFTDADGNFVNAEGNEVAYSPEWTFNSALHYERPISVGGSLVIDADYRFIDDRYDSNDAGQNNRDQSLPGYGVFNTKIGYKSADERWAFFVWGKNVTDSSARIFTIDLSFTGNGSREVKYIQPRTWGASVAYNF